jgi:hypothetical protein
MRGLMPNPTQVVGIIEVETTADFSVLLFGSVKKVKALRWGQSGAAGIEEAVTADLESLQDDLSDEYDAFCERLAI